ncbi:MAG: hypothetical protein K2K57_03805 [Oscillospiraceae bacterium]|nr:hypothetical protein [Oscillospiraceae bacterium]
MPLKYPILLAHGMGFRDDRPIGYWGRIPGALEARGERIFYSRSDGNGSIEGNARQMRASLEKLIRETGAEKVNIIAHSKGGLEARYLISTLGYGDRVASLTTLSTPHNGSVTVDRLMKRLRPAIRLGCKATDFFMKIGGDKSPDTYGAVCAFETANAERFNRENPDIEGVYYQSYAFVMNGPGAHLFMSIPMMTVRHFEGENDGLLAPSQVCRGDFKGIYTGSGIRGISHCDEVDMRRAKISIAKKNEGECGDIIGLYIKITEDLEAMGF